MNQKWKHSSACHDLSSRDEHDSGNTVLEQNQLSSGKIGKFSNISYVGDQKYLNILYIHAHTHTQMADLDLQKMWT